MKISLALLVNQLPTCAHENKLIPLGCWHGPRATCCSVNISAVWIICKDHNTLAEASGGGEVNSCGQTANTIRQNIDYCRVQWNCRATRDLLVIIRDRAVAARN